MSMNTQFSLKMCYNHEIFFKEMKAMQTANAH